MIITYGLGEYPTAAPGEGLEDPPHTPTGQVQDQARGALHVVVILQSLSCVQCTPGSSVLHYLPEFAQTHVH